MMTTFNKTRIYKEKELVELGFEKIDTWETQFRNERYSLYRLSIFDKLVNPTTNKFFLLTFKELSKGLKLWGVALTDELELG